MAVNTRALGLPRSTGFNRFVAELRALLAVAKKEMLYFLRYPSWVIQMLVWPLIFPLTYIFSARALAGPDGAGLAIFTARTGITDFTGFIAVGTTIWMWQNTVLWGVGQALRTEQWRGTLESNWMSPSWRFSFLLGPSLVHMLNMFIFLFVSAAEFGLFLGVQFNGNPLLMIMMALLCIPSLYGLGMSFASLVIWVRESQNVVFMVRGLVMIFCGITFPITLLPGWMQGVANWMPQTYMMHGIRAAALANASLSDLAPDITALVGFGVFYLVLGFLLFTWTERRARRKGTLGQY